MYLNIVLPQNLGTQLMLDRPHIPCFCKIGGSKFELSFHDPLPEATGLIYEWDIKKVDQRVPAGAGGAYTHYCFATVSLKRTDRNQYKIIDLTFFKTSYPGWFPIIQDGEWAEPVSLHTPEEQAEIARIDTLYPPVKLSKKQMRRLPRGSTD